MARKFSESGIPAESLDANSAPEIRRSVQGRLREREINFIFVVDLYNEGVDIPEVDTVLFLRPTESMTVFLQQLGRGLRISEGKECLTVLDFIGQAHQNYRFDLKFRGLLTDRSRRLDREIESGFPHLPAGCAIQMEKMAQRYILDNIRHALRRAATKLAQRLAEFEQDTGNRPTLAGFLEYYDLEPDDIYRRNVTWSRLCVRAGLLEDFADPDEAKLNAGLWRVAHINDSDQIDFLLNALQMDDSSLEDLLQDEALKRRLLLLHFSLWGREWIPESTLESIIRLRQNPNIAQEFEELLNLRRSQIASVPPKFNFPFVCPLRIHSLYTRDEILAALGHWTLQSQPDMREGVLHLPQLPADIFLITLNKTDHEFSPTTMYNDYAISNTLFHWQSQSTTSDTSPTGRRYIEHEQRHHHILLFVRENRKNNGFACPFHFLGPATYVSHQGSRPMSITWRLHHPMPAHLLRQTSRLAVA